MQAPIGSKITPEVLEQNPLLAAYLILVVGVVMLAALGSFATWGLVFYRRSQSQQLLPLVRPWAPRRWAFADLIVLAVSFVALQLFCAGLASRWVEREAEGKLPLEIAAAGGLGGIIAVIFGAAWICLRYKVSVSHLGFDTIKPRTIATGLMGGLLSLPLLYVLMGLVSSLAESKYDHPLINSASESGQLTSYLLGFFAAAIAAPISEEFFFRVILQGWLQSIPFKSLLANFVGSSNSASSIEPSIGMAIENVTSVPLEAKPEEIASIESIYASTVSPAVSQSAPASEPSSAEPPIWPSVLTGILFGLAHFEYGVSFIPLSCLGIFLGLIYRQTHSIWPCIIIHMMLNSFSMMMLGLLILMKQAGLTVE